METMWRRSRNGVSGTVSGTLSGSFTKTLAEPSTGLCEARDLTTWRNVTKRVNVTFPTAFPMDVHCMLPNCIELHRIASKSIEVHRIPVFSMSVFMSKRSLYLELLDFVCPVRTTTINQILRSEWIQEHARPRQSVFHPSLFFTIVNGKLIQIVNHLSLICVESL